MKRKLQPVFRNPWVVYNLKSLFGIFGIYACAFFGAQAAAATLLAYLSFRDLDLSPVLVVASYVLLCLVIDLTLFLRLRGRIHTAWSRPAWLVLLLTVLPCGGLWVASYNHLLIKVS